MRALIIVDVQNDFCEGGALAVPGGASVARSISNFLAVADGYDHVVATRDCHIDPGDHFSEDPDYATSWPPHCIAGSVGAQFHPALNTVGIDAVFTKGAYDPGYSGFAGVDDAGTLLPEWLRQHDVDAVDVVGIATDHCVRATAEGAVRAGFATRVLLDLAAGMTPASTAGAVEAMRTAGVELVPTATVVNERGLLAVVERSPRAAAARDRAAWVGLFTGDGVVEDPVGAKPHVGAMRIGRFYDTFIGPRDITFHRDLDIVDERVVIRDLELEVRMSSAVTMRIPAFLRYDLRDVNGVWKIAGLRAYWELPAMMGQFLRNGTRALPAAVQLTQGLRHNQGLRGIAGFGMGFRRAGARHKRLVGAFMSAVAREDVLAAARVLAPEAALTWGDNHGCELGELVAQLGGAGWTKIIGAGPTVVVSILADNGRGVLFADLTPRGHQITRIRYFTNR